MKEFSKARHNLRKELKPILQELKENKKQLVNVSQLNDKLRQQRRKLVKQAKSLRSAIQSLKQGQSTAKANNPQLLAPTARNRVFMRMLWR